MLLGTQPNILEENSVSVCVCGGGDLLLFSFSGIKEYSSYIISGSPLTIISQL